MTEGTYGTLVVLDRHLQEQPPNENRAQSIEGNSGCGTSITERQPPNIPIQALSIGLKSCYRSTIRLDKIIKP
jgi:hypothetical protein